MHDSTPPPPAACPSCGALRTGRFCAACGEKRLEPAHDHSLLHLCGEFVEGLTHLDSRLFRTFGTLLLRPGQLTHEHLRGARVRYMGPLQTFFVTSVVFYLFFTNAYAAEVSELDRGYRSGALLANLLQVDVMGHLREVAAARGQTIETLVEMARERAGHLSKLFLAAMLPAWGLVAWACCWRQRRQLVPHLVFAIHALCAFLLLDQLFLFACSALGYTTIGDYMFLPLLVAFAAHLLLAFRRVYDVGWVGAAWRTATMLCGCIAVILVYRQLITVAASLRM